MARVNTNNVTLYAVREVTLGTIPTAAAATWLQLEPNEIGRIAAEINTVARNPISANRQRLKGITVDLDSGVEFAADLIQEHFQEFVEGFVCANVQTESNADLTDGSATKEFDCFVWTNNSHGEWPGGWTNSTTFQVTAATGTGFTISDDNLATAASSNIDPANRGNMLVYARGFTNAANNGLHVVTAITDTELTVAGLTAEASPPAAARVEVCGFRFQADDLEVQSYSSPTLTLETAHATLAKDLTQLPLHVGQVIWVGGDTNVFSTAGNGGFVRIKSIAANAITADKVGQAWTQELVGTSPGVIDIFFGRFLKNVATTDSDYIERSYTIEGQFQDLGGVGTPEYIYAKGNACNTLAFELPLADKATMSLGFVGTDTDNPTTTKVTTNRTDASPSLVDPYNTSADIARLRVQKSDETGLSTDFKRLTITLNNNISPEKVLGTLGAKYMNYGDFHVDINTVLIFSNGDVIDSIRNNDTTTFDFAIRSDDGTIFVDIPSMILDGGGLDLPENESVLINVAGMAFKDATLSTSIGVTMFPYTPAVSTIP